MDFPDTLDGIYTPTENIVAREIEGEIIIVPLVSGMGDTDDELFTLNETGRAIWGKLDGVRSLRRIIDELSTEYESSEGEIEADVLGIIEELYKRKMIAPR